MSNGSEAFNNFFWTPIFDIVQKFQECSGRHPPGPSTDRMKYPASPRFAAFLEPKGQAIALSSCGHVACMDSFGANGFPKTPKRPTPPPMASTGWFVGLFLRFFNHAKYRSVRCVVVDWYWYWLLQKVIAILTPSFKWTVVKSGGSRIP